MFLIVEYLYGGGVFAKSLGDPFSQRMAGGDPPTIASYALLDAPKLWYSGDLRG